MPASNPTPLIRVDPFMNFPETIKKDYKLLYTGESCMNCSSVASLVIFLIFLNS